MRIFWIAGEPSGDVQAAALVAELGAGYPELKQVGWGGNAMKEAGMEVWYDLPANPIMGFVEVLMNAKTIRGQFLRAKSDILRFQPDLLILVDFPGFNLRLAEWATSQGIKVVYFIPPKVWAWKQSRLKKLAAHTDLILSILPFEEEWYAAKGHDAFYVGNPLAERYQDQDLYQEDAQKIVLLPGSRSQEISRLLPVFFELAADMPEQEFHIVRAASVKDRWPSNQMPKNLQVHDKPLAEVAKNASFALTCSGTASLEIALLGIPQAVVYKANPISLTIARMVVSLKYFSLPNLILDRLAVPELLQGEVSTARLKTLIQEGGEGQRHDYALLRTALGSQSLGQEAVSKIVELLNPTE